MIECILVFILVEVTFLVSVKIVEMMDDDDDSITVDK